MKMELGELMRELQIDLKKTLEGVIERFQAKQNPYYVLVYAAEGLDVHPAKGSTPKDEKLFTPFEDKTIIRTRVIITDHEPPRMLGTLCYKVDNQKGQLWRLWALPLNIPNETEPIIDEEKVVKEVLESSQIIGKLII